MTWVTERTRLSVIFFLCPICYETDLLSGLNLLNQAQVPCPGQEQVPTQEGSTWTMVLSGGERYPTSQSWAQSVVVAVQQTIQDPGEYGDVIIGLLLYWWCWRLWEAVSCKQKETCQKPCCFKGLQSEGNFVTEPPRLCSLLLHLNSTGSCSHLFHHYYKLVNRSPWRRTQRRTHAMEAKPWDARSGNTWALWSLSPVLPLPTSAPPPPQCWHGSIRAMSKVSSQTGKNSYWFSPG